MGLLSHPFFIAAFMSAVTLFCLYWSHRKKGIRDMWKEINLKVDRGECIHKSNEILKKVQRIEKATVFIYAKNGGNPAELDLE